MGNNQCCCQNESIRQSQMQESKLVALKYGLNKISMSHKFQSRRLLEFHHWSFPDLIRRFHKPEVVKKEKNHYASLSQLENNQSGQQYTTDAYQIIKKKIQEQKGSFFKLILKIYFKFLENLFIDFQIEVKHISQKIPPVNPRCHFLNTTQLTKSSIKDSLHNTSHKYVRELANSFTIVVEMLRFCLSNEYQTSFDELPQKSDNFPAHELIIQRLIQNFLLIQGSIGYDLVMPLVLELYRKDLQSNSDNHQEIKELNASLVPIPANQENRYQKVWESSFQQYSELTLNLPSPSISKVNDQSDPQIISLQIQPKIENQQFNGVPYYQTFQIIKHMNKEVKFWRIWRLIETMDSLIVQIFLNHRDDLAYKKLLSKISAEDNKSDILLYILSKYIQQYENLDHLQCMVKFMFEYDAILHSQIKFIYSPPFIRFYSILEMAQQGPLQKI